MVATSSCHCHLWCWHCCCHFRCHYCRCQITFYKCAVCHEQVASCMYLPIGGLYKWAWVGGEEGHVLSGHNYSNSYKIFTSILKYRDRALGLIWFQDSCRSLLWQGMLKMVEERFLIWWDFCSRYLEVLEVSRFDILPPLYIIINFKIRLRQSMTCLHLPLPGTTMQTLPHDCHLQVPIHSCIL